jgi:hypothetical protein
MKIKLDSWEYEWASSVGIRRFTANWNKKDASHYKKERMEDDRTAQVAAAVCELAVAKATGQYWSGHVWPADQHERHKKKADVGQRTEVRRTRNGKTVAVRKHQVGQNLILVGCSAIMPELVEVDVLGYIDYDKAWNLGQPSDFDPDGTRYISIDYLSQIDGSRAVL